MAYRTALSLLSHTEDHRETTELTPTRVRTGIIIEKFGVKPPTSDVIRSWGAGISFKSLIPLFSRVATFTSTPLLFFINFATKLGLLYLKSEWSVFSDSRGSLCGRSHVTRRRPQQKLDRISGSQDRNYRCPFLAIFDRNG